MTFLVAFDASTPGAPGPPGPPGSTAPQSAGVTFGPFPSGSPSSIVLHDGRPLTQVTSTPTFAELFAGAVPDMNYPSGFDPDIYVWRNEQMAVTGASPITYNLRMFFSEVGGTDWIDITTDPDTISTNGLYIPLWSAAPIGHGGVTFSYTGGKNHNPVSAAAGHYTVAWRLTASY